MVRQKVYDAINKVLAKMGAEECAEQFKAEVEAFYKKGWGVDQIAEYLYDNEIPDSFEEEDFDDEYTQEQLDAYDNYPQDSFDDLDESMENDTNIDELLFTLTDDEYDTDFHRLWLYCLNTLNVDKRIKYLKKIIYKELLDDETNFDDYSIEELIETYEDIAEEKYYKNLDWKNDIISILHFCEKNNANESYNRIVSKLKFLVNKDNNNDLYNESVNEDAVLTAQNLGNNITVVISWPDDQMIAQDCFQGLNSDVLPDYPNVTGSEEGNMIELTGPEAEINAIVEQITQAYSEFGVPDVQTVEEPLDTTIDYPDQYEMDPMGY